MASRIGQRTFSFALIVPGNKAKEVEDHLALHAAWMRETHSLKADFGNDGKIQLVDFHWAKSEELTDPINPSSGTTGNILYALSEVYVGKDGIDQHMALTTQWDSFQQVASTFLEHGKVMLMGGTIIHAME